MFRVVPFYKDPATGQQFSSAVGWGEELRSLRFKNRLEKIYHLIGRSQKDNGISQEELNLLMTRELKALNNQIHEAIFGPILKYREEIHQFHSLCHELLGFFVSRQSKRNEPSIFRFQSGDGTSPVEAASAKLKLNSLPDNNSEIENFLAAYLLNTHPSYKYGPIWLLRSVQACWVYLLANRDWITIRESIKSLVGLRSHLAPNHYMDYRLLMMTELMVSELLEYQYWRSFISETEANPNSKQYKVSVREKNRILKVHAASSELHRNVKLSVNLLGPRTVFKTPEEMSSELGEISDVVNQVKLFSQASSLPESPYSVGRFCTTTGHRPTSWIAYQVLETGRATTALSSEVLATSAGSSDHLPFRIRAMSVQNTYESQRASGQV